MNAETDHVGAVTLDRYHEIVIEGHRLVEEQTRIQFSLGDLALETEPMQALGGHSPSTPDIDTVHGVLTMLAEDIDIPFATLKDYRWVASRWPKEHRAAKASWRVYKVLAADPQRFSKIQAPPKNMATGRYEWTSDMASREVGLAPEIPRTSEEKINKVHELVRDEDIASTVVTQLLYRPEVAHRAMSDSTARFAVNRAQVSRTESVREFEHADRPSVARVEHSMGFYELAAGANAYVASVSRGISNLKSTQLKEAEIASLQADLRRVRAAANCVEQCINHDSEGLDAALAKILKEGAS